MARTLPPLRSRTLALGAALIASLAGCVATTPEAQGTTGRGEPTPKSEVAPPPAPTETAEAKSPEVAKPAEAADVKEMDLEIKPDGLTVDDAKGKVVYDPDGRRMTDHYTTYEFNAAEFKAVVGEANLKGGALQNPIKLRVAVLSDRSKNSTPKDPNMPSPMGGFTYQTITCKALKLLSSK